MPSLSQLPVQPQKTPNNTKKHQPMHQNNGWFSLAEIGSRTPMGGQFF
jgi:hypothetical protein